MYQTFGFRKPRSRVLGKMVIINTRKNKITPHFVLMKSEMYAQCEQLECRIKKENYTLFFCRRLNRELGTFAAVIVVIKCKICTIISTTKGGSIQHTATIFRKTTVANDHQLKMLEDVRAYKKSNPSYPNIFRAIPLESNITSNQIFGTFSVIFIYLFTPLLDKSIQTHITQCVSITIIYVKPILAKMLSNKISIINASTSF